MKSILLLMSALTLLSACGGGRNYLAVGGNRCPAKFGVELLDETKVDMIVPFDIAQLPVGQYEYAESQIYYTQTTSDNQNPTMISVSERAIKSVDRKTQEEVVTYNESTSCARNISPGQDLAFSYTLTTDFSIAEAEAQTKTSTRSGLITTRVANVLMSKNTNGALVPSYTTASNKEASDKLTKFIPEQTELRLYKLEDNVYELRTQSQLPTGQILSVVKYYYKGL